MTEQPRETVALFLGCALFDPFLTGTEDQATCDLLRAQTPPRAWFAWRVRQYPGHRFALLQSADTPGMRCSACPLLRTQHVEPLRDFRMLLLLVDGPLRHLSWRTDQLDELPPTVRNWLHTLLNIAGAVGVHVDGWAAYSGRRSDTRAGGRLRHDR